MMTTEVQELQCELCGFTAMNKRSLRAHVGMLHKPGKNGHNGTAPAKPKLETVKPSSKDVAIPIKPELVKNAHDLKPWVPVMKQPGIVALGFAPLLIAGLGINILGVMVAAGLVMITPLALIAAWILAAKQTVRQVLVVRMIDDQPVWDWPYWTPEDVRQLPEECKRAFKGGLLPVIDATDPLRPISLMPYTETPPRLSSEKLGESFIQDDSQFLGQPIGGGSTVGAVKLGIAGLIIAGLMIINYVMISKAFEQSAGG